jgi:acyl-CoA synthetase (AMP-forming)/AMP-acid ligase II
MQKRDYLRLISRLKMNTSIDDTLRKDCEPFDSCEVEGTILDRFARIVDRHGDKTAIHDSVDRISYRELDSMANRVANQILLRLGAGPEPVALLYRPGVEHCAAQLGVLKSGKFFASFDHSAGVEGLDSLAGNLAPHLILHDSQLKQQAVRLATALKDCEVLDTSGTLADADGAAPTELAAGPDSIAYIVYTSGSTGRAEGVVVSHRSLLHMVRIQTITGHLGGRDRALQICHLSGAASVSEIYSMLLSGGTLYPFDLKALGTSELVRFLERERITVCTLVPVVFRLLTESQPDGTRFEDMRLVRLSGDRILKRDHTAFRRCFTGSCVLRASLGAAEAMIYSHFNVRADSEIGREFLPAGYVLPDYEVKIVDDAGNSMCVGEVGEIAVRSRYLAFGYWRNSKLTAERFPKPVNVEAGRCFLTRDIGYFEPDGCLIHLGRKDSRVKIHGKLVNTGDIEEFLLARNRIEQTAVLSVPGPLGESMLICFFVATPGTGSASGDIKSALKDRFPLEVVPRRVIQLQAFPVTGRNKIDRRQMIERWRALERSAISCA